MKKELTVQDIQQICDTFNTAKESESGFILYPSIDGFDVFQISKERLKKYLEIEALYTIEQDESMTNAEK